MARFPGIVHGVVVQMTTDASAPSTGNADVDRVARVIVVFDFGFSQRRLLDHAPHHRLRAAVEETVGDELEDFPSDLGFRRIAHGGVRVIPVADHAEPLELLALHRNPVLRIGPALLPEGDDRLGIGEIGLRSYPSSGKTLPRPCHSIGRPWQSQPGT